MRLSFHTLSLHDKELILKYTLPGSLQNCDLSFANLMAWRFLYHTEIAVWHEFLLFRFYTDGHLAYQILGEGDWQTLLETLDQDACSLGYPLLVLGLTEAHRPCWESLDDSLGIHVSENRDFADYIYARQSLETLAGKKLQPKRNHVNKFKRLYPNYAYYPLTEEWIKPCLDLNEKWLRSKTEAAEQQEMAEEHEAICFAMSHWQELDLIGGVLVVDGQLAAFTYGAPINADTFDVCVEKADVAYEGIYAMINQQFVTHLPPQYVHINREEDMGIPGLRQAKMSYVPENILMKYALWTTASLQHQLIAEQAPDQVVLRQQTRALWQTCFHDSDAFLDLFFKEKYHSEQNTFFCQQGQVVAALQRLPYELHYEGIQVPVAYIYAACTDPEWRRKGYMTRLLQEAHRQMSAQKKIFSFLIPAEKSLFSFYERVGYVACLLPSQPLSFLPVQKQEDDHETAVHVSRSLPKEIREQLQSFMIRIYEQMPCCILHTVEDLAVVLSDLELSDAYYVWAVDRQSGQMEGVMLAVAADDGLLVKECLALSAACREKMAGALQGQTGLALVYEQIAAQVRVTDVPGALQLYATTHPQVKLHVQVLPDVCHPEQHTYRIENGRCDRVDATDLQPDKILSVSDLPGLIFADHIPYITLMLN